MPFAPGAASLPACSLAQDDGCGKREDDRTTTTTRTERRVQVSKSRGCRLNGVARLGNTVGAAKVEEVGVNQGDDILGEVRCLERNRREVPRLPTALHELAPVGHLPDPPHRPDPD